MATGDPELGQGLEGLVVEGGDRLALEWTVTAWPSRVWMCSWRSMKSKSMVKIGLPSSWPMGRVVMPRPVRWKGTFHQWLRRTLAASRSLPTTWQNRCRVCLVSRHSARASGETAPCQDA